MTRAEYLRLLAQDQQLAWPWERIPDSEVAERKLSSPTTNLGSGRGRMWHVLQALSPRLDQGLRIGDFGAYPGTAFRLVRQIETVQPSQLVAFGFGFSSEFRQAMAASAAPIVELEFDLRPAPDDTEHILSAQLTPENSGLDVALCTEVIEHQHQPLSLLLGMRRYIADGGHVLLTTNSVSFVGDIAKLATGRHNVEALHRSHILTDSLWRPHMRLFTAGELTELFELCGYEVRVAQYVDNGNVYRGAKGVGVGAVRAAGALVPHLRSHVFVHAVKTGDPSPVVLDALRRDLRALAIDVSLSID